jgi:uncharacterized protein YoxC
VPVLRELITKPFSAAIALIELPITMRRSLEQANELMETSRRQMEQMQRQTDSALDQAERLNDILGKVVRLTEPLEKAQRGGEFVGGALKRVIFGEAVDAERAATDAERAASDAERAAAEAEEAASRSQNEAIHSAEDAEDAAGAEADGDPGLDVSDPRTIRVKPDSPPPAGL